MLRVATGKAEKRGPTHIGSTMVDLGQFEFGSPR
jgi:hypothetical protein